MVLGKRLLHGMRRLILAVAPVSIRIALSLF
jgi:hypothetical protein